jgi:hypothetical protein
MESNAGGGKPHEQADDEAQTGELPSVCHCCPPCVAPLAFFTVKKARILPAVPVCTGRRQHAKTKGVFLLPGKRGKMGKGVFSQNDKLL